jgi:iduronate 2-sulfatase
MACVSYTDAQIGKVLDELRRLELDQNTAVVLWSDHGWHLGEHGMFGKQTNYEVATRSPLIIRTPGMAQSGAAAGGLAESVDLYPTLTELCGLDNPAGLTGASLVPALRDPSHPGKDTAYSFHPRGKIVGRTLRTDRYRIVVWRDSEGQVVQTELYDHRSDPEETVNVAASHSDIVSRLTRQLASQPAPSAAL